jgi:hypothetical protein
MRYFMAILSFVAAACIARSEMSTDFGSMVFYLTNRDPADFTTTDAGRLRRSGGITEV